jgi:hypothetical protein
MSLVKFAAIEIKKSHEGSLHQYLGIAQGEAIPTSLIDEKLKTEKDPAIRKKLNFAKVARKWHHK